MKFIEGEVVLARWPNSSEYHKGKVLNATGDEYRILFEKGKEFTVPEDDIKPERSSRSATRTSNRVTKSPSKRSPSRRSPSRRSPSRRSPARSPKTLTRKLPLRRSKLTDPEFKTSKQMEEPVLIKSHMRDFGPVTRRSVRLSLYNMKPDYEEINSQKLIMLTRKIDRAVSLPVEKRSEQYDFTAQKENKERGMSMQRDQDMLKKGTTLLEELKEDAQSDSFLFEKPKRKVDLVSEPQEWGGWFGALVLIFAFPVCVALPQIACSNNKCDASNFRVSSNWRYYFNLNVGLTYGAFICFQALLSILPIGKLIDGQQNKGGRLQYRINGVPAAILSLGILGISEFQGYKISDFLFDNCLQLMISGWLIGTILAVALYIKSGRVSVALLNMYASTNNLIYDFWQGREINPRVGPVDIKMTLFRTGLIGMLLLNTAVVIKSISDTAHSNTEDYNFEVLTAAALQMFYALDALVFESAVLTSFGVLYEGTGYMLCVGHLIYPFMPTLCTRYLYYHRNKQSGYYLGLLVVLFFIGYILYRSSNAQKDEFRKNPLSPGLAHMECIRTAQGKKLLVTGWWGHVRHPNYLGDIIMQWSVACICLTKNILPYYAAICFTLILMYRAIRDNTRCTTRYGSAWTEIGPSKQLVSHSHTLE